MRKLVIVQENPKDAPQMSEALAQQGHKVCLAYIEEDGKAGEQKLYHCTPEMLKDAVMPKKLAPKTAEPKKAPPKAAAPKKAAPKKALPKK